MTAGPADALECEAPITVLCVDDRSEMCDLVAAALGRGDRFEVRTAPDAETGRDHLGGVDCVVSDYEMPGEGGLEFLDTVREYDSTLPFVLFTSESDPDVISALLDRPWTDYIEKSARSDRMHLLEHRVASLVAHRRSERRCRRALAAVDASTEAIAIAAPDGTVTFANRPFARLFGHDREALVGRSWRTVFTDAAVERLESEALPTVADDWRWSGECTGRRPDGATVPVGTRVVGLDDDSLVFVVSGAGRDD